MTSLTPADREAAERKAAAYACHVEAYIKRGLTTKAAITKRISMTEATEAIWGTSGRGNPNAVRIIEATATLGYLHIKQHGRRTRYVSRTDKPIPDDVRADYARDFGGYE